MIIKPRVHLSVNKPIDYTPEILEGFTIVRDTREQLPYEFKGIEQIDRKIEWGDYSIVGHEPLFRPASISIERKSVDDFYGSITHERERFKNMMEGLRDSVEWSGLVIEANESEVLCPELSGNQTHPHSVYGTLVSIEIKYGLHIYYGDRASCELKVLSWLCYFYKMHSKLREKPHGSQANKRTKANRKAQKSFGTM